MKNNNPAPELSDNFIAKYIMGKLTDEETNQLIEWVKKNGKNAFRKREREVFKNALKETINKWGIK